MAPGFANFEPVMRQLEQPKANTVTQAPATDKISKSLAVPHLENLL